MIRDPRFILISINGLLLLVVVFMVLHRQTHWQVPAPIPPALSQLADTDFLAVFDRSAQMFPQIIQKPLFWPSRKPAPPKSEAIAVQPLSDPLKDAQLLGTFVSGSSSGAILRVGKQKEVIRMMVGESYKGMSLSVVGSVSAEFTDAAKKTRTLMIDFAKQPDTPAVATPSLPAGAQTEVQQATPAVFDRWVPNQPRNEVPQHGSAK
jgi:hypothetical protein